MLYLFWRRRWSTAIMKDGLTISWSYCTARITTCRTCVFFFILGFLCEQDTSLCRFQGILRGNQGNDHYQLLAMALAEFYLYFYYRSKSNIICRLTSGFLLVYNHHSAQLYFFSLHAFLFCVSKACCQLIRACHSIKPHVHSYISTDLSLSRK